MKLLQNLKEPLLDSETKLLLLLDLKYLIKSLPKKLISKLKLSTKNLNNLEKNNVTPGNQKTRICTNCKQELPLDLNNFQSVTLFKSKFSYYCNNCNTITRRVNKTHDK